MIEPLATRMADALERIARAQEKLAGMGEAPSPGRLPPEPEPEPWASLPVGSQWMWTGALDVDDPDYRWFFRFSARKLEGGTFQASRPVDLD